MLKMCSAVATDRSIGYPRVMKNILKTSLAVGLLAGFVAAAPAPDGETLKVGDPAPALSVAEWVKGDQVEGLAKGQVYLIEFWATW